MPTPVYVCLYVYQLLATLKEFERLTGVDITAEDAIGGMT